MEWTGYTEGSCYGDKVGHGALPARVGGGRIREGRGFAQRGRRVSGHVPKRRNKGGKGVRYGDEGAG